MKKILTVVLCAIALTASATETVTIVYSWSAGDQAANYYRAIAESANKMQSRYTFIVDYKPGAGGALAATHVAKSPNTILATSSAFFIRPLLYPNDSGYSVDNYQELLPICFGAFAISSSKYKTWAEVPVNQHLTIGVSGMGTTTHLTALQIAKQYPQMDVIAFKSTSEAAMSALSGQTDFAVSLMGDVTQYEKENPTHARLYVLGTGGNRPIEGRPLLINQGFGSLMSKMGSPAQLIVPSGISKEKYADWMQILAQSAKTNLVRQATSEDFCYPTEEMLTTSPAKWYQSSRDLWAHVTKGIETK